MKSKPREWIQLLCAVTTLFVLSGCKPSSNSSQTDDLTRKATVSESQVEESLSTPGDDKRSESRSQDSSELLTRFQFRQCASDLGIDFTYRNGEATDQFAIIENLGGGVAIFDFDSDGRLDLLFAGGGLISAESDITGLGHGLYRQAERSKFTSVSTSADFAPLSRYGHGVMIWDRDNDGFADVLTTGYGGVSLLQNNGDGTFCLVASEALSEVTGIVTAACSGDFNGDGIPDLFITTYVNWSFDNHVFCPAPSGDRRELCSPKEFAGTRDYLFISQSDGTLQSVEAEWLKQGGKGLGALACDVDHDGDVDIYVANDTNANFLYTNRTTAKDSVVFEDTAMLAGVALDERGLPNGSMGLTACDVNHDLQTDIWVANYERESFAVYRNEGLGSFLHTSRRYGIAALGGLYVGFGTDWEDFDHDGREEIVVSNGHVLRYPTGAPRQQHPLLLAREGERFVLQQFPEDSYFAGRYDGRGLAVGDLNQDGRPDVVISHINQPVAVLINETESVGRALEVKLVGTQSSRDAVGAHVVLSTSHGQQLRSIVGGGSYLSHNDRVAHFGIPAEAQIESLTIYWPSGIKQTMDNIEAGELLVVETAR